LVFESTINKFFPDGINKLVSKKSTMKKFKFTKDILIVTIITLLTVLTWVGFEVWLAATQTTITKVTKEQLAPVNPNLSQETIESLKNNFTLSEEEMTAAISSPSALPETETSESPPPEATESSQTATESSQTGTESANLE